MKVNSLSVSDLYIALKGSQAELGLSGRTYVYFKNGNSATWAEIAERLFHLGEDCLLQNFPRQDRILGHKIKKKLIKFWENTQENSLHSGLINKIRYLFGRIISKIRSLFILDSEYRSITFPEDITHTCSYYDRLHYYEYFQGFFKGRPGFNDIDDGIVSYLLSSFVPEPRVSFYMQVRDKRRFVRFYRLRGINEFSFMLRGIFNDIFQEQPCLIPKLYLGKSGLQELGS